MWSTWVNVLSYIPAVLLHSTCRPASHSNSSLSVCVLIWEQQCHCGRTDLRQSTAPFNQQVQQQILTPLKRTQHTHQVQHRLSPPAWSSPSHQNNRWWRSTAAWSWVSLNRTMCFWRATLGFSCRGPGHILTRFVTAYCCYGDHSSVHSELLSAWHRHLMYVWTTCIMRALDGFSVRWWNSNVLCNITVCVCTCVVLWLWQRLFKQDVAYD